MSGPAWIPFEKQRPAENALVWYFFEHVGVHLGTFHAPAEFCSATGFGFLNWDVTHWMPVDGLEHWPRPCEKLLINNSDPDFVLALEGGKFGRVFFKGSDRVVQDGEHYFFERTRRKRVSRCVDASGFQYYTLKERIVGYLAVPSAPVLALS